MLLKRYVRKHMFVFLSASILSSLGWAMMTGQVVFWQLLVDRIVAGDRHQFVLYLAYLGVSILVMVACYYAGGFLAEKFKERFLVSVRSDVYRGIMRRGRADYETRDTAEYMSNVQNDPNSIAGTLSMVTGIALGMAVSGAAGAVIMFVYNVPLALVAIAASFTGLLLPFFFSKQVARRQKEISTKSEEFSVQMKETFEGREVISGLGLFRFFEERFAAKNRDIARANYRFGKLQAGTQSISHMSAYFTRLVVFVFAGFMALGDSISLGTLVLFISAASGFASNMGGIMQLLPFIRGIKPISDKLLNLIDYRDESFQGEIVPTFNKEISTRNISFAYNGGNVLESFDFTIKRGEKIAITGPSGCGKTTLMKLLQGEYANYSGEILYDGVELRKLDNRKMHRCMTIVSQNVYIFNDTIKNNICLGESFGEAEMEMALKRSGVDKFLTSEGLESRCGDKGANLSGGQRQRIALARSLVRGIKLIVLDEGVSAIDVETANEIEQELLGDKDLTLISITHRIKDGLIGSYDRVIRMEAIEPPLKAFDTNLREKSNLSSQKVETKMEKPKQEKTGEQPAVQMMQLTPGQNIADLLKELQEKHGGELKVMTAGSIEEAQKMVEEMQGKS